MVAAGDKLWLPQSLSYAIVVRRGSLTASGTVGGERKGYFMVPLAPKFLHGAGFVRRL